MPTLFPDEVPLPNGPLLERPSALLAAYKAGQHHEDTLWLFVVVALVLAIGACIVRTRLTRCGLGSVRDATQFRDERRDALLEMEEGASQVAAYPPGFTPEGLADEGQDSPATLPGFTPEVAPHPPGFTPEAWKRMLPHAVNFEHARLIGPVGASPVSPGRAWAVGGGPGEP